jgi:large subunit ribosomal protein LP2
MLVLAGNESPSAADVTKLLGSVGIDADKGQLDSLIAEVAGKDLGELIKEGSAKLASVPSGGARAAAAAAPAGGAAPSGGAAKADDKQAAKEESEDEGSGVSCLGVWLSNVFSRTLEDSVCSEMTTRHSLRHNESLIYVMNVLPYLDSLAAVFPFHNLEGWSLAIHNEIECGV